MECPACMTTIRFLGTEVLYEQLMIIRSVRDLLRNDVVAKKGCGRRCSLSSASLHAVPTLLKTHAWYQQGCQHLARWGCCRPQTSSWPRFNFGFQASAPYPWPPESQVPCSNAFNTETCSGLQTAPWNFELRGAFGESYPGQPDFVMNRFPSLMWLTIPLATHPLVADTLKV